MRARSVATRHLDAYRAGLELGDGLRDMAPEVVFLFSSIHYQGDADLLAGLCDALERAPIIIGATGDGFYETVTVADIGASALGLDSGGRVGWHLAAAEGVSRDIEGALDRCVESLQASAGGRPLRLGVLFCDFRADAARIVAGLDQRLDIPIVGGLAGDEYRMERCFVYANGAVLDDGLAILGATGDLPFTIHLAGQLAPVGQPGVVTAATGTTVHAIDGASAMDFITRQSGKPLSLADLGISAFSLTSVEDPALCCLRTIREIEPTQGAVTLFGAVEPGERIQFCQAVPEEILQDVRTISSHLRDRSRAPVAGLVISCAGRKHVLAGRDDDHEVGAVREGCGQAFPLAGFPSFGEIGPRRTEGGYTRTLFHNMTYILLVFET
jgi:hypothetical protein